MPRPMPPEAPVASDGTRKRFAILVDGDNAQPGLLPAVVAEVSKYGVATVRRAYGNWRSENLKGWIDHLQSHAFIPVHHSSSVTGKNSTDTVLIIDAMDLLYSGTVEAFCIVSSDSDYTRLAIRLRESGKMVIVIGRENTSRDLKGASDMFVATEVLLKVGKAKEASGRREPKRAAAGAGARDDDARPDEDIPLDLIEEGLEGVMDDDGWAHLGSLGNLIRRLDPAFDSRNHGYATLGKLIQAEPDLFEYRLVEREDNGQMEAYVRRRSKRAAPVRHR